MSLNPLLKLTFLCGKNCGKRYHNFVHANQFNIVNLYTKAMKSFVTHIPARDTFTHAAHHAYCLPPKISGKRRKIADDKGFHVVHNLFSYTVLG